MYITRSLEKLIKEDLFKGKVIIVYGARQVGKTTLVKNIANKSKFPYLYLNCDQGNVAEMFLKSDTSEKLKEIIGDTPLVLIDEAQRVKNIGLKLKLLVDNYPKQQIIATGSSSFDLSNEINEPLTGRVFEFLLHPFTLKEIAGDKNKLEMKKELDSFLVYGSYPEIQQTITQAKKIQKIKYISSNYLYKDILKFNNIKNSDTVLKLLQALALQIGSEVSYNELATLVGISKQTVSDYISLLEKAFIIFRLSPYSTNLRKELGKLRKIYFFDLGIRNAIINNLNELNLRDDVGRLWENFVIAEKYKAQIGPGYKTSYYFWRTYDGQEVDLVESEGGTLHGWEAKWSNKKTIKAPSTWRNSYPKASWELVTPQNYLNNF